MGSIIYSQKFEIKKNLSFYLGQEIVTTYIKSREIIYINR